MGTFHFNPIRCLLKRYRVSYKFQFSYNYTIFLVERYFLSEILRNFRSEAKNSVILKKMLINAVDFLLSAAQIWLNFA